MPQVLSRTTDDYLLFYCPGCKSHHGIPVNKPNQLGAKWSWNGSMECPTFSPSIKVRGTKPITDDEADRILAGEKIEPVPTVCHSYVTDGNIQFLGDCTHELAGQTVPLESME